MATSGSYNYNNNGDATITLAFQLINVYGLNDTVSTNDKTFARNILNGMLKLWATEGINVTKRKLAYLFPALDTVKYELGSGGSHCTNAFVQTTILSNEASGQTVLSLTSTSGMTAADNIGIELNTGARQWTTIVSVDSSTQVTITTALTAAADLGKTVVTYTSKINRPLEVPRATSKDIVSGLESKMASMSYNEYYDLPLKTITATAPYNFYYDKVLNSTLPYTSSFYVFPEPTDVNSVIVLSYIDSIQDVDSSSDDIDLPQEYSYPIAFNLACELAYPYGKFQELAQIKPKADELKNSVRMSTADNTSIIIRRK